MSEYPILQFDLGNSSLKVRWIRGRDGRELFTCRYHEFTDSWLRQFPVSSWEGIKAQISSVVSDQKSSEVISTLKRVGVKKIFVAKVLQDFEGLHLCYEDCAKLGVDRWLVMLAAAQLSSSFCVFDFGTAITADVVTKERKHLGGYIIPGRRLMSESLGMNTAQVGVHPGVDNSEFSLGTCTRDCVNQGINRMVSGFLEEMRKLGAQLNIDNLIFTGGDVDWIQRQPGDIFSRELLFDGLSIAAGNL